MLLALLVLQQNLPACPTGRYGIFQLYTGRSGSDRDTEYGVVWVAGAALAEHYLFGTLTHGVGGIFLVGPGYDPAALQPGRDAYLELRVRRICAVEGYPRLQEQLLVFRAKFVQAVVNVELNSLFEDSHRRIRHWWPVNKVRGNNNNFAAHKVWRTRMKHILIIGAGRSTTVLIEYLLSHAAEEGWRLTICDSDITLAAEKAGGHPNATARQLDALDAGQRHQLIEDADLVVSMLPPRLHTEVARDCLRYRKDLVNASYVHPDVRAMHDEVKAAGLTFMCELGLDPGIDHMSAMQLLDDIRGRGGRIDAFYSYTGGLVAPESDDNPWHYKFSWAPRNVVVAGQGTAQYMEDGQLRLIPYQRIFEQIRDIDVPGMGHYEVYANRNSLSYYPIYGLDGTATLYRGTIRYPGFCRAWQALIRLGLTEDQFLIPGLDRLSYRGLISALLPDGTGTLEDRIGQLAGPGVLDQLRWLGLLDDTLVGMEEGTPADVLERLLLSRWKLEPADKDMIIMQHEIDYTLDDRHERVVSTLVSKGADGIRTAMSTLVGLPMAIFARKLLRGEIRAPGVNIPVDAAVYEPVLRELRDFDVTFQERTISK